MNIIESDEDFYKFIGRQKPVIVIFSTHTCHTCVGVEEKIENSFKDIEKAKVYLDDLPLLRGQLGIFNVPVVSIYFDSQETAKFIRVFSIDNIKSKINRLLEFV